jgi:hypothetical protein
MNSNRFSLVVNFKFVSPVGMEISRSPLTMTVSFRWRIVSPFPGNGTAGNALQTHAIGSGAPWPKVAESATALAPFLQHASTT